MNTSASERRSPGRPRNEDRAEETRTRRRKRHIGEHGAYAHGSRLGVDHSLLDFNAYEYRWINDDGGRLIDMTQNDDWDIVSNNGGTVKLDARLGGSAVATVVGKQANGNAMMAYLCRKPKDWYEEDQAEKSEILDRQLAQLRRGNDADGGSQSDYVRPDLISIPD